MISIAEEHLLKRELLRIQLAKESEGLDNMINIDQLGYPFKLPNGQMSDGADYPLFSYVLEQFVVTFPLVENAKLKFWQEVAQPFVQGLASKEISSSADRDEATKRRKIGKVFKRMLFMFYIAGLSSNRNKLPPTTVESSDGGGDTMAVDAPADAADTTETADADAADAPVEPAVPNSYSGIWATVLGCEEVSVSSFLHTSTHSEYILECYANRGAPPIYVKRTWNDFVQLAQNIKKKYPGKEFPHLPIKTLKNTYLLLNNEEIELLREPQRVLLREYINKLCVIPRLQHSQTLQKFLFSNPIELQVQDRHDIEHRLILDKQKRENDATFLKITLERESKLNQYIGDIKKQIILEDALPRLFMEMKTYNKVEDMGPLLQHFVEWCLVQLAQLLYKTLIASDHAPELFSQIKRLHSLMPYLAMRGILKLSNPALIFKKMTELFMATPFGSKSLLQQMFIRLLSDDMKTAEDLVSELQLQLKEKDIIAALDKYIHEDYYTRVSIQKMAQDERVDLVYEIIRTYCTKQRKLEVAKWHKEWEQVVNNSSLVVEEQPLADKYAQYKDLLKLKARAHDKDVLRDFWGDPETIRFIREIVNLTYDVLIDMFRYANISDSLADFQKFMNDLISYVDSTYEVVVNSKQMIDELIKLLQKHQNSIFKFINRVYSRDKGFFVDLIKWMSLFVDFVKRGKMGEHKLDLLKLVENHDSEEIQKELQNLQEWLELRKKLNEDDPGFKAEDFPSSSQVGIQDVNLNWEDIEFELAEMEQENMEEFIADPKNEFANDSVAYERAVREKQAELAKKRAKLPPRPSTKNIAQLQPEFEKMLFEILSGSKLQPFDSNVPVEKL